MTKTAENLLVLVALFICSLIGKSGKCGSLVRDFP